MENVKREIVNFVSEYLYKEFGIIATPDELISGCRADGFAPTADGFNEYINYTFCDIDLLAI